MGGLMSRNKGKRAEREVVDILQSTVNTVWREVFADGDGGEHDGEVPELQRNLMQSHKGGHDIAGLEWLAPEVKHHEQLSVGTWWEQTLRQAGDKREPVLFYRKNHMKWRVRWRACCMTGYVNNVPEYAVIDVEAEVDDYLQYFAGRLRYHLTLLKNKGAQ